MLSAILKVVLIVVVLGVLLFVFKAGVAGKAHKLSVNLAPQFDIPKERFYVVPPKPQTTALVNSAPNSSSSSNQTVKQMTSYTPPPPIQAPTQTPASPNYSASYHAANNSVPAPINQNNSYIGGGAYGAAGGPSGAPN